MRHSTSRSAEPVLRRETVPYRIARVVFWGLCRLLFRLRVEGREHVPPGGPLLVVSNHCSIMDPVIVALAVPRRMLFVAAAEYGRMPILGTVMRWYGVVPVRRTETDLAVIPSAVAALRSGQALGIFPEGGITRTPGLRPFKTGAAMIAAAAGCPIVPVAVIGSDRAIPPGTYLPRPRPVEVHIGPPLQPPRSDHRADLEAAVAELHAAIQALLPSSSGSPMS